MSLPTRTRARWLAPVSLGKGATVTVIIPCFNYAAYVAQAVHSAVAQTGVEVDVVIVDDCSTDHSLAVARELAQQNSRVQVLANRHNLGPVGTFNRGLATATGEFLVRLDADDLLTPGSLARAVAVMQACPRVGLVYGRPLHFGTDQLPAAHTNVKRWLLWDGLDWLQLRCEAANNVITSPEVLMRASVVAEVGGQLALAHTHDMEMWLRIAAFSDVAYIQGPDQAWHREHRLSLSMQNRDTIDERTGRKDAFDALYKGIAESIPQADQFHRSALRALAVEALNDACQLYDRGAGR